MTVNSIIPRTSTNLRRQIFNAETLGDLMSDDTTKHTDWLVEGVIEAMSPTLWTAERKCCKTTLAVELAISIATGGQFLGCQTKQSRVLLASVEDGRTNMRQRLELRLKTLEITPPKDDLIIGPCRAPLSEPRILDELMSYLTVESIGVLIVDPAYLMLGNYQQTSLNDVGNRLFSISDACHSCGTTCIVMHHAKREGRGLSAASGAGFSEWAGNWMSIERIGAYRKDGKHNLRLDYGGRAGQQGEIRVNIDEGIMDGNRTKCSIEVTKVPVPENVPTSRRKSPTLHDIQTAISKGCNSVTAIQKETGGSKKTISRMLDKIHTTIASN